MGLWQDLQFAVRLLIKDKWFTLVAAVALALGIGVNATVFTFVNAVLIRGLPIPESHRAMAVGSFDRVRNQPRGVSYLDFRDWRDSSRSFEMLGAYNGLPANVSDEGQPPERFQGSHMSAVNFQILGTQPVIGRTFTADEDRPGAAPVVILGHGMWVNRYGSNPSIIGRTIMVNDIPATVLGVKPDGFKFPFNTDVWLPLGMIEGLDNQRRNSRSLNVFGRLAAGVSREQAQSDLINISRR